MSRLYPAVIRSSAFINLSWLFSTFYIICQHFPSFFKGHVCHADFLQLLPHLPIFPIFSQLFSTVPDIWQLFHNFSSTFVQLFPTFLRLLTTYKFTTLVSSFISSSKSFHSTSRTCPSQTVPYFPKLKNLSQMVQTRPDWFRILKTGSNWSKLV